jgi:dolichol-phosphate mannosyltransferase
MSSVTPVNPTPTAYRPQEALHSPLPSRQLSTSPRPAGHRPVELAVVLPTFNERDNVPEIIARVANVLDGLSWEIIFVDDDSPDGTAAMVESFARSDSRIRLLQRIGRRGLSSACIEGILATNAPYIAVMDADLQHDETILPRMYDQLRDRRLDLVVGTRNSCGGSTGQYLSKLVCRAQLSDPMSGFFLLDRRFFLSTVRHLHGCGFKILLDLCASSPTPVRLGEVGYRFRQRTRGESKLDLNTKAAYLFLVANKLSRGLMPTHLALFALVLTSSIATHLLCLSILLASHFGFAQAQALATLVALTQGFLLGNMVSFRDLRLRGPALVAGLVRFWLACAFGAWADVLVARSVLQSGLPWYAAGFTGIVIGSVWSYAMGNLLTWKTRSRCQVTSEDLAPASTEEVSLG